MIVAYANRKRLAKLVSSRHAVDVTPLATSLVTTVPADDVNGCVDSDEASMNLSLSFDSLPSSPPSPLNANKVSSEEGSSFYSSLPDSSQEDASYRRAQSFDFSDSDDEIADD